MKILVTLTILFAGPLSCAATEVATWTDTEGVVHFSDRAPARQHKRITVREPNIIDPFPVAALDPRSRAPRARVQQIQQAAGLELEEKCHRARLGLEQVRATRRAGYRLSEARKLDALERRHRADWRFYCRR